MSTVWIVTVWYEGVVEEVIEHDVGPASCMVRFNMKDRAEVSLPEWVWVWIPLATPTAKLHLFAR